VSFDDEAARLDRAALKRIHAYLQATVASGQPRSRGQGLSGPLAGYWRYRIGDFRVIADIQDKRLVVIAIRVGHLSGVYKDES
jgi:mRNA interferase RelE/StbE